MPKKEANHWNYRVFRITEDTGIDEKPTETYLEIRRVHYKDGKTESYSEIAPSAIGGTKEELKQDLLNMIKACDKPILEIESFFG